MAMTDPIADLLTRIRNAGMAQHPKMDIPSSNVKVAIAEVLKDLGYIKNFKVINDDLQGVLRVYLKYDGQNAAVIHEITRVSKPGRRVYVGRMISPASKTVWVQRFYRPPKALWMMLLPVKLKSVAKSSALFGN